MSALTEIASPAAAPHCAACVSPMVMGSVRGQTQLPATVPDPVDIGFQAAAPNGPTGSRIISAFTYDTYWVFRDSPLPTDCDTAQFDFVTISIVGQDLWHQILDNIKAEIFANGGQVIAYILWEAPLGEVSVPTQICAPWANNFCWTPPGAGQVIAGAYTYRLWVMTAPFVGPIPFAVSPMVAAFIPVLAILSLILAGVIAWFLVMATIQVLQGKMTLGQALSPIDQLARVPGETFGPGSFTGPLIAFGITLIAAGIFVPMLAGGIEASVPIGPANVQARAGTGAGGGRRRR